jgi:hypothetical protein
MYGRDPCCFPPSRAGISIHTHMTTSILEPSLAVKGSVIRNRQIAGVGCLLLVKGSCCVGRRP